MKVLSLCWHLVKQDSGQCWRLRHLVSHHVPSSLSCHSCLCCAANQVSHTHSQNKHYRSFSTSFRPHIFWRDRRAKVPNSQKVNTTLQQHDGKSLVDRYIFVKTLDNFYEDVPNGIILDTAYADSRPGEDFDPSVPVVVGLHDTPGDHHDLLPLLSTFAKLGCRTITPTFPGHGNTQGLMRGYDDVFCQSTLEKAMFVHDFLGDLGIPRVDVIVAVGAACYTALKLSAGGDISQCYKSVALISPWPLQRPRYEPNPELTKRIQSLWDRPMFRAPVRLLLPAYKCGEIHGTRNKITTAYLLSNLDLGEAGGLAMAAGSLKVPRVVIFGEMDACVEKELYYDVLDKLEIPKQHVSKFRGKLEAPLMPGALVFPEGGYDLHLTQSGLLSAYLLNLVRLFHPHIRL